MSSSIPTEISELMDVMTGKLTDRLLEARYMGLCDGLEFATRIIGAALPHESHAQIVTDLTTAIRSFQAEIQMTGMTGP